MMNRAARPNDGYRSRFTFGIWFITGHFAENIRMDALLWILLPGFVAIASGLLSWFVMQSRMEVKLAEQRENITASRAALEAEKKAMKDSLDTALHAAEESALRKAFDSFLGDIKVQQRHFVRENRMLIHNRKSLVMQERMYFRNIPLSDWIEHEVVVDDGADVERLVQDMTVFDKAVVSIADAPRPRQKQLAPASNL
jgi:hypothetical protein